MPAKEFEALFKAEVILFKKNNSRMQTIKMKTLFSYNFC